jgi:predicted metalloprotease with PDZ domain
MHNTARKTSILFCLLLTGILATAQQLHFTVSMEQPASHYFHVVLQYTGAKGPATEFKMPVWTPGYYQRLDYAQYVEHFTVTNQAGDTIPWEKSAGNAWRITHTKQSAFTISYDVKTTRLFVANPWVDEERGFIRPASVFIHPAGKINLPVTVQIKPYSGWHNVATGLDSIAGKPFTYTASNFDVLYDSPFLIGNLEELPTFTVQGIPHRFIGYKLGDFDRQAFINDLQKIVTAGSNIIGHIPYKHYTFLSIGPKGMGGIEQLNSTAFTFNGEGLNDPKSRIRSLNFLAHEYFHHYNVKRIRPIELGPFDYDNGNRTNLLWVSEGLSVYYEYLLLKRAGISTEEDIFDAFRNNITAFQTKPGRLYQSLQQASYNTWSDGPFGRKDEKENKTISYYDKGPAVGLLFDFAIRHSTNNKKSLDDVMRTLYKEYYQKKKRGFTEKELRTVIEQTASVPLDELFDYIYTTKELDYNKYLNYAGLTIDTTGEKPTYNITRLPNPNALQKQILESWLGK